MPRNSSGVYQLPAGNPVVTGKLIESIWANSTMSDIEQALTDSLDRFGRSTMAAPLLINDGTVSAPGVAFGAESSTGLFRKSAKVLAVAVGGVEAASFTETGMTIPLGIVGSISGKGTTSGGWSIGPVNASGGERLDGYGDTVGLIDLSALANDNLGTATIRMFRNTNTTGVRSFQILRGDNTGTVDHNFLTGSAGVLAKIAQSGGRVLVGGTTDNAIDSLQVMTTARVRNGAMGGASQAAQAGYDEFVLEGNAATGMSILVPNTSQGGIAVGDTDSPIAGFLLYAHSSDAWQFGTEGAARLTLSKNFNRSIAPLYLDDGTAALPSLAFTNSTTMGLFRAAANALGFATGGVEKMRLLAAADGSLLINTATSLYAAAGRGDLEINGSTSALLGLNIANAGGATIGATATSLSISTASGTKPILFSPGGTESMRITGASWGEVLINTNTTGTWSLSQRGLLAMDGTAGALVGLSYNAIRAGWLAARGSGAAATDLMLSSAISMPLLFAYNSVEVARVDTDSTFQYTPPAAALANAAEVGFRQMPANTRSSGAYTMVRADRGGCIIQTIVANVITAALFVAGDVISVSNKSGSPIGLTMTGITCNWGPGTPLVGNRTLANNGFATYVFTGTNVATLMGSGIS